MWRTTTKWKKCYWKQSVLIGIPFCIWRIRASESNQILIVQWLNWQTPTAPHRNKTFIHSCNINSGISKVKPQVIPIRSMSCCNFTCENIDFESKFQNCFRLAAFCSMAFVQYFSITKKIHQKKIRHAHLLSWTTFVQQLEGCVRPSLTFHYNIYARRGKTNNQKTKKLNTQVS